MMKRLVAWVNTFCVTLSPNFLPVARPNGVTAIFLHKTENPSEQVNRIQKISQPLDRSLQLSDCPSVMVEVETFVPDAEILHSGERGKDETTDLGEETKAIANFFRNWILGNLSCQGDRLFPCSGVSLADCAIEKSTPVLVECVEPSA